MLLTAKSKREEALEGLRVGADDFLSKPVAPDQLIARLSPAGRRPGPGQSQSRAVAQALFRARCFVYLVVDARRALIAAARLDLQRAVGGQASFLTSV